jgi:hypothetical protein
LLARLSCAQIIPMSIGEHKKSVRGRPKVDSEMVRARFERRVLDTLDRWRADQPEPKPSRPEAIRRLVEKALEKP